MCMGECCNCSHALCQAFRLFYLLHSVSSTLTCAVSVGQWHSGNVPVTKLHVVSFWSISSYVCTRRLSYMLVFWVGSQS